MAFGQPGIRAVGHAGKLVVRKPRDHLSDHGLREIDPRRTLFAVNLNVNRQRHIEG